MSDVLQWIQNLYSTDGLKELFQMGGIYILTFIIFAETGLLAGFFLPGDSLLITAGIFCSSTAVGGEALFDLPTVLGCLTVAAILGDQLGYFLGRKTGPWIFQKEDSLFFRKRYLNSASEFYSSYGGKALIAARFMPIFRTFVPFFGGVARMPYRKFVGYSVSGGVLWIWSMTLIGFYLGKTPLANHLHKVIIIVILVSLLPVVIKSYLEYKRAAINRKSKLQ